MRPEKKAIATHGSAYLWQSAERGTACEVRAKVRHVERTVIAGRAVERIVAASEICCFLSHGAKAHAWKLALALFTAMAPTFVPQAGASLSFSWEEVLLQANLGMMSSGRLTSEADGLVAACGGLHASLQAALARGWPRQVEQPHTQLRAFWGSVKILVVIDQEA